MTEIVGINSDVFTSQLRRLDDLVVQLKAKQDSVEEERRAWQERVEAKMDQQLALSQQLTLTRPCSADVNGSSAANLPPAAILGSGFAGTGQTSWTSEPLLPSMVMASKAEDEADATQKRPSPEAFVGSGEGSQTTKVVFESAQSRDSHATAGSGCGTSSKRSDFAKKSGKNGPALQSAKSGVIRSESSKKKRADQVVIATRRNELLGEMTFLNRLTTHRLYEVYVMSLIILNAFAIGWQVQVVALRVDDAFMNHKAYDIKPPAGFVVMQSVFAVLFAVELFLRWLSEGFFEFLRLSDELPWNVFDIVTVISGMVELILEAAEPDSAAVASISVIRVFRVMRLVRLVRMIRVYPFFHELRMMVESCLNSLKLFLWLMMVLMILTYIFGLFLTTGTCSYLANGKLHQNFQTDPDSANLHTFWGSVDKSMLSLFQTITGGRDWFELYDRLLMLDASKRWIYLLYISFATFAVCNVVAAVFVESAMQSSAHDRELLIREQLRDSQVYQEKMQTVFEEMDADGTGTISEDEFMTHLDDQRVIAYFNTLKLDVTDATALFKLLDVDRSGSVEINEFIDGCQRLKGESRTLDMHLMRYELSYIGHELHEFAAKFYGYAEATGVPAKRLSVLKMDSGSLEKNMPHPYMIEVGSVPPTIREAAQVKVCPAEVQRA